jgi:hypothetical protein
MAGMDIFNSDAFSTFEMTAALDLIPRGESTLGDLGIFEERLVRTTSVAIERRENGLALVPVTPRGAPLPQLNVKGRNIRNFNTVRVAKGDRVNASELQNIRAFGTDSELAQVQAEIARRMALLRNDVDLTHEHMRLGALQGRLLDADGSVLYDFWQEWQIAEPAEINFALGGAPAGNPIRVKAKNVIRTMKKASKGMWGPGTRVGALVGSEFFDALINSEEVNRTYLNQQAAADLREESGAASVVSYGGILWMEYEGSDAGEVAIDPAKARFFPMNLPGAFLRVNSPGESEEWVNTPGKDFYAITVPDTARRMWTDVEVYSYPLYVPTRVDMLFRGKAA